MTNLWVPVELSSAAQRHMPLAGRMLLVLLVSSLAQIVHAEERVTGADVRTAAASQADAHSGFFARMSVGFGGSRLSSDRGEASLGGVAAVYDFALGYRVMARLAIHVSYFGARAMAPTLKVDGHELKAKDQAESSLNGVGAGLTYSFPSNLYLSPALGLGIIEGMDIEPAQRDVLNPGFAASLTLGYEWQVSEDWGLGAAVSAYYFRAKDTDGPSDLTWQGFAAGPAFSATYN